MSEIKSDMAPTILTIFGITGDLSQRKLFPALLELHKKGLLPERFRVVGVGRRAWGNAELKAYVLQSLNEATASHPSDILESFASIFSYIEGDLGAETTYHAVSAAILHLSEEFGQCTNKLFYLAVPPDIYRTILTHVASTNLAEACGGDEGWARILIEKPFGNDMVTAEELDRMLGELFREEQIFRIDHYLGKETLQNILTFRFSNLLYESLWNNLYIEKVHIRLLEEIGVGSRGNFYDGIGALRDVGQNHILQMLALVAMENPGNLDAGTIRARREEVMSALVLPTGETIGATALRGQYEGYQQEEKVNPKSTTDTYFLLKSYVHNSRWEGVPFYLEAGKKIDQARVDITIYFKEMKFCLCEKRGPGHRHPQNMLRFRIQPDEAIQVWFWVKEPGFGLNIAPAKLSYLYSDTVDKKSIPDAYARVLYDCFLGDQTLFVSTKEIQAEWKFVSEVAKHWEKNPLLKYVQGSNGPDERGNFMEGEFID